MESLLLTLAFLSGIAHADPVNLPGVHFYNASLEFPSPSKNEREQIKAGYKKANKYCHDNGFTGAMSFYYEPLQQNSPVFKVTDIFCGNALKSPKPQAKVPLTTVARVTIMRSRKARNESLRTYATSLINKYRKLEITGYTSTDLSANAPVTPAPNPGQESVPPANSDQ